MSAVHDRANDYFWYPDSVTENFPKALRYMAVYFLALTLLFNTLLWNPAPPPPPSIHSSLLSNTAPKAFHSLKQY